MIRPLTIGDAGTLAAVAGRALSDAIADYPDLHTPDEDVAFYQGEIDSKAGRAWADDAGVVVGFVIWRTSFIDHLYVEPAHQRAGIGTALLERAVSEMDGPDIRLWTFQANARAVAFYARNGFRIVKATDGSGNEEHLPDYLFGRP